MPLRLTLCNLCAQSRPEILQMVECLLREHSGVVQVISLNCMAACDDAPAVMIETDYFPRITPQELYERVSAILQQAA